MYNGTYLHKENIDIFAVINIYVGLRRILNNSLIKPIIISKMAWQSDTIYSILSSDNFNMSRIEKRLEKFCNPNAKQDILRDDLNSILNHYFPGQWTFGETRGSHNYRV